MQKKTKTIKNKLKILYIILKHSGTLKHHFKKTDQGKYIGHLETRYLIPRSLRGKINPRMNPEIRFSTDKTVNSFKSSS